MTRWVRSSVSSDWLPSTGALVLFYLSAGVATAVVASGGGYWQLDYLFTYALLWPFSITSPEHLVENIIGIVTGLGVVSLFDRAGLPLAAPAFASSLSTRRFGEFLSTLALAELVSRIVSPAFFVGYLHAFPTYRGQPGRALDATWAYYQAGGDAIAGRWAFAHVSLFGRILPNYSSILAGDAEIAHAAYQVVDIALFGGVAFAVLLGYPTALVISYGIVRISGRVLDGRRSSG